MPKILIIDDEPTMRELLMETLEKLEDKGVGIFIAEDGEEGIEIARTEKPDLIILDVMMQGMNGYQVCDIVKNNHAMKDVCVLMLTANVQGFNKQKYKDVGADNFMTKPFNSDEIIKKAAKILEIET